MTTRSFATLIFKGGRFEGAAMPLEALPELAAYQNLVLAIAKALWQKENPERQRLPRGFERNFRLVMTGVEPGSTVPQIMRAPSENEPLLPIDSDLFDRARDFLESALKSATNGALPDDFPPEVILRFSAFGQTLAEHDEYVLIGPPGAKTGVRYDRSVRKRILLSKQGTYEDAVSLVGEVRMVDKDHDGFTLASTDGRRIPVHAPPLFFKVMSRSLDSDAPVRVRGTGVYDHEGTLTKIVSATDVSLAEEGDDGAQGSLSCPTPVAGQVESLRAIGPGWFDKESLPLSTEGLTWMSALLSQMLPVLQIPTPYLYPTPEGHIRAEWSAQRWELFAEFDLAKRCVGVLASRIDSDEIHERDLSFANPGAELQLGDFLREHLR